MGPGLLHPGNNDMQGRRSPKEPLQWGRGCYTPETRLGHVLAGVVVVASTGPGLLHPGNGGKMAEVKQIQTASMGPGLLHPGNVSARLTKQAKGWLQWGRGCYTQETRL